MSPNQTEDCGLKDSCLPAGREDCGLKDCGLKRLIIACDSFKDSLGAFAVCEAVKRGVQLADPGIHCTLLPMADGGEGTAEILAHYTGGQMVEMVSVGPLFRPVKASYGISKDGRTAFIDMAACSGLQLLKRGERNPMLTSTFGTGLMIKNAVERGAEKIVLGIGGSATNDAGMGMATALGFSFFDKNGKLLKGRGKDLRAVAHFTESGFLSKGLLSEKNKNVEVEVLCDVNNVLYGAGGASLVYAPQKGADGKMVTDLDLGLRSFAEMVAGQTGRHFENLPGAGAAGGTGFGAKVFLQANLTSGIDKVLEAAGFERLLEGADLVITGEGKIDEQTASGKLIAGICRKAKKKKVPVAALCGALEASPEVVKKIGLAAAFSIVNRPMDLEEALKNTAVLLEETAAHLVGLKLSTF